VLAPEGVANDVVHLLFAARAHAAPALDAGVEVHRNGRMRDILRRLMPRREAGLADRELPRPLVELGIERVGRLGNVRQQQLEHHLLAGHRARAVGGHLHAVFGIAAAGRREHPLALDLDHACAAVAIRPHALLVAKVRDLDAVARRRVDEALVGAAHHGPAVQHELDRLRRRVRRDPVIGYFDSHGSPLLDFLWKVLDDGERGFGAACPSPQIDASTIACR